MAVITIKYVSKGNYQVLRTGQEVATITKVHPQDKGNWHKSWHWALTSKAGRIDRHDSLADAKSDALKIGASVSGSHG